MLRIKGFAPVDGKPMRLVVQGVGRRVAHHFDRPWKAGEARDGRLVVIGLKGFDREGRRGRFARQDDMHLLPVTAISLDDGAEAVDLQPAAGGYRGALLRGQRPRRAGGRASADGRRAIAPPRLAAPPAPSPFRRSLCRQDRRQGALRAGALPRRARLLALRHRAPRGGLPRARHQARGAAGRRPARSAALQLMRPCRKRSATSWRPISAPAASRTCAACSRGSASRSVRRTQSLSRRAGSTGLRVGAWKFDYRQAFAFTDLILRSSLRLRLEG